MLRPQKLAKGPLKAFKGKGGKCCIEAVSWFRQHQKERAQTYLQRYG